MTIGRYACVQLWTACLALLPLAACAGENWPDLPDVDGAVEIPAQEWPLRPGPRRVRVLVHYPQGKLQSIDKNTGVMLTLHNWGGTDCQGTADPRQLANELNVVALCVNYLQSGRKDSIEGPEPYDFGYLQALDALRALYFAIDGLKSTGRDFSAGRIYCTGGSGGGNVTLMANKLAPRTFACAIDMCGMKKLSDDIAFNLPGGSDLNARYGRDPSGANYLSLAQQELCFVGNPEHLDTMRRLGATSKIVVVHGVDDVTCPFADAEEMVGWMRRAGLDVEPRFVTSADLDGTIFTSAGHALGNRTQIVLKVAGGYLRPDSPQILVRSGPSDFERGDEIRYAVSGGEFVISYAGGYPVGRFQPSPTPTSYSDHTDVLRYVDRDGQPQAVETIADWESRRKDVLASMQQVMGPLPSQLRRVPLAVRQEEELRVGDLIRRKVTFQSDPNDRVAAFVFLPATPPAQKLPAVLCLHQTAKGGKNEPAGIDGNPDLKYALELAQRGYVTVAPDYPSFGEHAYDFAAERGYASGTMKAIWDNIRTLDLLESMPEVDADRIGCIGHSLGGHNTMFTALFEPRIKALVSSCGFSSMQKDDLPSWTGQVYMPRIKTEYGNDVNRLPFDFHEIVACFAPRPFLACAAERDNDFDASGVRDVLAAAQGVYALYGAADQLAGYYPSAPHSFPPDARKVAYEFLDRRLKP